jgi:hypothetical protein
MAIFPDVCPVSRRFTAGRFPTRRFNSISGAGTTRLYGSKAFDSRLQLEFIVDNETAGAIFDAWYGDFGGFGTLELPPEVLSGDSELLDAINPEYLEWRWENEPSIESIQPGLSRVTVNLVGRLEIEP